MMKKGGGDHDVNNSSSVVVENLFSGLSLKSGAAVKTSKSSDNILFSGLEVKEDEE